jgi:CHAD domain-containing protein
MPEGPVAVPALEVEWQFELPAGVDVAGAVEELARDLGYELASDRVVANTDHYLDTTAWDLRRAGAALRIRDTGEHLEATLKQRDLDSAGSGDMGGPRSRLELNEPFEFSDVATGGLGGPVGARLRAYLDVYLGGAPLAERLLLVTQRRTLEVTAGRQPVASVSIDRTCVAATEFSRIEVESAPGPGPGPTELAERFARQLQQRLSLIPASEGKVTRGMRVTGVVAPESQPPAVAQLNDIAASSTVGELAAAVLGTQAEAFANRRRVASLGLDPAAIHAVRVSLRRLRSAIAVFDGSLPKRARKLQRTARQLRRRLSDARDLDVALAWLAVEFAGDEWAQLRTLVAHRRDAEQEAVAAALGSSEADEVLSRTEELASASTESAIAERGAREAAVELMAPHWKRFRRRVRRLGRDPSEEALHRARISTKSLRYGAQFFVPVRGQPARVLARAAEQLQDDIGAHHDEVVILRSLQELVAAQHLDAVLLERLREREQRVSAVPLTSVVEDFEVARGRWREFRSPDDRG